MNHYLKKLLIFSICITSLDGIAQSSFSMKVLQGNLSHEISYLDTTLILKPEEFKFEFVLHSIEGVFSTISYQDNYYNTPLDTSLYEWEMIPFKVMAEEEFNIDKDMVVSDDGFCYWFYEEDKDWYRMDKSIEIQKKSIKASYTVNQIYDREKSDYLSLNKINQPIYLVFFIAKKNADSELTKEYERKRIAIRFEK